MNLLNLILITYSFVYSTNSQENIVILKLNDSDAVGAKLFTAVENKPYAAFWKVPFAVSPVQELRFKSPKPHEEWSEYFSHDYTKLYNETCLFGFNEDCLYLSIFMPLSEDDTKTFAILVWIHEESNFHGPDFFIDDDVLVVTISYRNSIIGFLNTGDDFAQGNMGAKDILLALKWIREKIHYFSGDRNKVTVAGSGTAANIVASFLVSFQAEDLFNRIIIQSGSALSPADYTDLQDDILHKLFCKLSGSTDFDRKQLYEILSVASTKDLMKAAEDLFDSTEVRDRQRLIHPFGPSIERSKHSFMNKRPLDVYKRGMANNDVEVMLGYASLEALYKLKGFAKDTKLLKYLNYNFQYVLPFEGEPHKYGSVQYEKIRSEIMDFYFLNGTIGERSLRRYAKYTSDQVVYPLLRQALLHAECSGNNVYVYRFSFRGALSIGWDGIRELNFTGATAGDEICYLFRCNSLDEVYQSPGAADERRFIRKIVRLWANFVKYGNPTPSVQDDVLGSLVWKPLERGSSLKGLNLGQKIKMRKLPEGKRMRFWEDMRNKYFSRNQRHRDEL